MADVVIDIVGPEELSLIVQLYNQIFRPGRDLARLIEVAAFQTKLKRSGYNPAKELNHRLIAQISGQRPL